MFEAQSRQKELLNIEIEIKRIELERLRELYQEEVQERLHKRYPPPPAGSDDRKSWLSYLVGK